MIPGAAVSVIVLNRDRIVELGRVLKALKHQTFRDFELIVVSNQVDLIERRFQELERATVVPFAPQNISGARNAGLAASQGDFIAFCDDDAVPEPFWLERLIAGFSDPKVGAVGGLVRGRNGVSIQWGPQEVDQFGNDWPLEISAGAAVQAQPSEAGRVIKTVGTNCALRRTALEEVGGFDEAYAFYLDETDMNFRLASAGWHNVIMPGAEVHHGYARSAYRTSERMPVSLHQIGASKAYFCKCYGDPDQVPEELDGFRSTQRKRMLQGMYLGLVAPGAIRPVLETLEAGFIEGGQRKSHINPIGRSSGVWQRYCRTEAPPDPILVEATFWNRRRKRRLARSMAEEGKCVTLFEFNDTTQMLTVRFTDDGYWWHRGGIFGRTYRHERLVQARRRARRIAEERERISTQRAFQAPSF